MQNCKMRRIQTKPRIFLDSGAFTAHRLGKTINIRDYIHFLHERGELFDAYANLDVIAVNGYRGSWMTAERTLEHQRIMEAEGLHPVPCFHYGEPYDFLQHYISNYDYICVSAPKGAGQREFLDTCFYRYICDSQGVPRVKVHGFAITSIELLLRYPFYSVDATTWMIIGRYGSILVPRQRNGQWIYRESPWKVTVSSHSPNLNKAGKHINTMTYMERQFVMNYITEKGYRLGSSEFV